MVGTYAASVYGLCVGNVAGPGRCVINVLKYRFDPDWVLRPGEILRDMLDEAGMRGESGVRFAAKLSGLDKETIQGIIDGKVEITKSIAERLAVGSQPLAISSQFWLNLEKSYRQGLARGKKEL